MTSGLGVGVVCWFDPGLLTVPLSLHCSSFLALHFGILNIELVKP